MYGVLRYTHLLQSASFVPCVVLCLLLTECRKSWDLCPFYGLVVLVGTTRDISGVSVDSPALALPEVWHALIGSAKICGHMYG